MVWVGIVQPFYYNMRCKGMKETKRYIIRSEDCRKTIKHMKQNGIKVDCVITSPPYNISRSRRTGDKQRTV